jgi:hypothetical protein
MVTVTMPECTLRESQLSRAPEEMVRLSAFRVDEVKLRNLNSENPNTSPRSFKTNSGNKTTRFASLHPTEFITQNEDRPLSNRTEQPIYPRKPKDIRLEQMKQRSLMQRGRRLVPLSARQCTHHRS